MISFVDGLPNGAGRLEKPDMSPRKSDDCCAATSGWEADKRMEAAYPLIRLISVGHNCGAATSGWGSGLADGGRRIRLSVWNPLVIVTSFLFRWSPKKFLDMCFPVRQFFRREDAAMFQSLESKIDQQSHGRLRGRQVANRLGNFEIGQQVG